MSSSAPLHMWLSCHSCNINYISFLTTESSDFSYWNKPSVIVLDSRFLNSIIDDSVQQEKENESTVSGAPVSLYDLV